MPVIALLFQFHENAIISKKVNRYITNHRKRPMFLNSSASFV